MLQTKCPNCKGLIKSPDLKDFSYFKSVQCDQVVNVEKVFVVPQDFTIDLNALHNRISRYESLLKEVEKERRLMAKDQRVAKETRQSFDQFSTTLQELLEGVKSHYRLKMTRELTLQMDFDGYKSQVKLIDISTSGASIEFELPENLPRAKSIINLQIIFSGFHEPLSARAKVVWVRKLTNASQADLYRLGVNFFKLDEKTRSSIWRFIIESSSRPTSPCVS